MTERNRGWRSIHQTQHWAERETETQRGRQSEGTQGERERPEHADREGVLKRG